MNNEIENIKEELDKTRQLLGHALAAIDILFIERGLKSMEFIKLTEAHMGKSAVED